MILLKLRSSLAVESVKEMEHVSAVLAAQGRLLRDHAGWVTTSASQPFLGCVANGTGGA
jgi:hypothetical protein